MTEWIELNLPYNIHAYQNVELPKEPDLSEKEIAKFGFSFANYSKEILGSSGVYGFHGSELGNYWFQQRAELRNQLMTTDPNYDIHSDESEKLVNEMMLAKKDDLRLQAAIEYLKIEKIYHQWYNEQLEIIEYYAEINKIRTAREEEIKGKSFVGLGLNKAGTLIEVENEGNLSQYLVGDININAGVCNDCPAFEDSAIVKRYKVVWSPNARTDKQSEIEESQTRESCTVCEMA